MIDLDIIKPALDMVLAHTLNQLYVHPESVEAKDKLYLLTLIDELVAEVEKLREEIQWLRDPTYNHVPLARGEIK